MTLRRAADGDIAFMMATERLPGYDWYVGQWDEATYREIMADPREGFLVGLDAAGERCGFAIFRHNGDRSQNLYLQRLAMVAPGNGLGRPMMHALMAWVFGETDTHRLWLHVKDGNDRAVHIYRNCGFTIEGRLREAFITPKGQRSDALMMSILRAEWPSVAASATT